MPSDLANYDLLNLFTAPCLPQQTRRRISWAHVPRRVTVTAVPGDDVPHYLMILDVIILHPLFCHCVPTVFSVLCWYSSAMYS